MNLCKATGTIGGLTMVSRVLGFAREMIFARIMGAGMAADAFALAFLIPNLFRRLFGEGAFSQGFVPLFSQRLHGEGGMEEAKRFAEEVLAVFLPMLMVITVVFVIVMPAFVWLIALGLARRSGEVRAGGRAVADHLPLSDLHQPGVALLGRAQLADPLHRRRLRPGPAQHRADRRAAAGARPAARRRREAMAIGGDRRRRAAARSVLGQRSAAPASSCGCCRRR